MIIEFERGLSDAKRWFRHSGMVIKNFLGKTVSMARTVPANPQTTDQTAGRNSMKAAAQAWRELPEPDRAAWNAYARRFASHVSEQRYKDLSGWEFFLPAWRNRGLLGSAPAVLPSDSPPPPPVLAVEEDFSGDLETYAFRITHGAVPDGHVLLVRMTPQAVTKARKPYPAQARMIRGHCGDSALPLPASGETVTFTGARFIIEQGQRFGLALRIVRVEDGIHSREFFADLLRGGHDQAEPASNN